MNKNDFLRLKEISMEQPSVNLLKELKDKSDRILLSGYTTDRKDWTVEIIESSIWIVSQDFRRDVTLINVKDLKDLIPNKRLYPDKCDFEFCTVLCNFGFEMIDFNFTTFT